MTTLQIKLILTLLGGRCGVIVDLVRVDVVPASVLATLAAV